MQWIQLNGTCYCKVSAENMNNISDFDVKVDEDEAKILNYTTTHGFNTNSFLDQN